MDVIFIDADNLVRGEVVIDSGAADNVMPHDALRGIQMRAEDEGVNFVGADGNEIGNYGRKDVRFIPTEFYEKEFGFPFVGRAQF